MADQKHILVVEDDSAADGISMRDFLQEDDAVDAIVLDAAMPGESSTALALHARQLGLPVVMISGSPEMIQFAIESGLQLLEKAVPNAGAC